MRKTKVATVTNTATGIAFAVVVVPPGAAYGLDDCLTNESGKPMVEFYDTRYPHTEFGQFVSRYYASSLLPWNGAGLNLDMGIPNWQIDAAPMGEAMDAVITYLAGGGA